MICLDMTLLILEIIKEIIKEIINNIVDFMYYYFNFKEYWIKRLFDKNI